MIKLAHETKDTNSLKYAHMLIKTLFSVCLSWKYMNTYNI